MTPGFSDNLQEIDYMNKTAVIDMELSRVQMDIVALQETRFQTQDLSKKKNAHSSGRENHRMRSGNMVLTLRLEILC